MGLNSTRTRYFRLAVVATGMICLGVGACAIPVQDDNGDDWILNPTTGHYYKLTTAAATPAVATTEATAADAELVLINDAAENQWLVETFGTATGAENGLWIAFFYDTTAGWTWTNAAGSTYTNWATGQPAADDNQWAMMAADGTWQADADSATRLAIMEREQEPVGDNTNENTSTGDYPAGARAYRIRHTGTGTQDLASFYSQITVDATGTIIAIPGEATTADVTYRVTFDFESREYEGATSVMEPDSFVFTPTVEWELYWDTIIGPECFQFNGWVKDDPAQTASMTVYGDGIALPLEDLEISGFSNAHATSIHLPYGDDTICDADLVYPHLLEDGGVVIDMTVTLTEIGFEELEE